MNTHPFTNTIVHAAIKKTAALLALSLWALIITVLPARADSSESLFEQANRLYSEKEFKEAAQAYESILKNGYESANLYFNLGNSYFKLGELPSAILNYERARKLNPNDPDIEFNLNLSYSQTIDQLEQVPELFLRKWYRGAMEKLSSNSWGWISLSSFILFLSFLLIYLLANRSSVKKIGFILSVVLLISWISSGSLSLSAYKNQEHRLSAIIFSPSAMVKGSPDKKGTDLFLLHEGTKVQVSDSLDNWYQIELSDGNEGWLEKDRMEVI